MSEKYTDDIIAIEFDLFDKVNNVGGRAACQDDFTTFEVMRGAQFDAWNEEMRSSYLEDLTAARNAGRNLVMEKYAYMTGYDYMGEDEGFEQKCKLVASISASMLEDTFELLGRYPNVMRHSRPIGSGSGGAVAIDSYLPCELMTYSVRTLELMSRYIEALHIVGTNLTERIHENIAQRYGFDSLDAMETRLSEIR